MLRPNDKVKPMPEWESILILLAIGLLGLLSFYGLRPWLEHAGWSQYAAYLGSLSIVFVIMLAWSMLAFVREGHPLTLAAFLQRTRITRPTPRVVIGSIGLGVLMLLSTLVFSPPIARAISAGLVPMPLSIPDYVNPIAQMSITEIKAQLVSQGVLPLIPLALLLNIVGEEIFWRGMVLPRQELRHGQRTFLVHGTLWALSHAFQYWLLPPILVGSLALAYLVQRRRNTWVGILGHIVNNGLPLAIIVLMAG